MKQTLFLCCTSSVGDQPRSDLVGQLHHQCVVVGCEILGAFFVSNLENSDCMVALLDKDKHHVANHLVQTGIDFLLLSKFCSNRGILSFVEIFSIPEFNTCERKL